MGEDEERLSEDIRSSGDRRNDSLWGGRFEGGMHPDMFRLTESTGVDMRLLPADVAATRAHARTLAAAGLMPQDKLGDIDDACAAIVAEWRAGDLIPAPGDEDVHSVVERELTDRLGETGARIHAGRSRNDLVAADMHLWCRSTAAELTRRAGELVETIAGKAEEHLETVMPGYTHMQRAQPVSLAFHLAAHAWTFVRDAGRFERARVAADCSVLGAGAVAGTTLPLDATVARDELGHPSMFDNAMDAVSDRDFVADLIYACALLGVHLSRLGEEVVLWTSSEFGFARLDDRWSTGSSMMPQKRNPDLAELLRGRGAVAVGELTAFLGLLKGLPLAYDRDLQEDKELVFRAADRAFIGLESARALIEALHFDPEVMATAARAGGAWATDVAETLVMRGVPFREAHRAAGELVLALERAGKGLADAPDEALEEAHHLLRGEDRALADPRGSMHRRMSHGATSPDRMKEQIGKLKAVADRLIR